MADASTEQDYMARRRGASKGAGWGMRVFESDGSSWLNCLSGGDVLVYDDKRDAELDVIECRRQAHSLGEFLPAYRSRRYDVERVEAGAWAPSAIDSALIDLMAFAMPAAQRGESAAVRAVNSAKALLSTFAPAELRAPLTANEEPAQ